jgi:predicted transcriptional regulator of viral defense system
MMKYLELTSKIKTNIFSFIDIIKLFPNEKEQSIKTQLSRFIKKGLITSIKKGLYCFDSGKMDTFILANILYKPSYISLETALNYYGIIPDIPLAITSISVTNTKEYQTAFGNFIYAKIQQSLYFGFTKIKSTKDDNYYQVAQKEKALLDYFYIRRIQSTDELRLNVENLDIKIYKNYAKYFPKWVQNISITKI